MENKKNNYLLIIVLTIVLVLILILLLIAKNNYKLDNNIQDNNDIPEIEEQIDKIETKLELITNDDALANENYSLNDSIKYQVAGCGGNYDFELKIDNSKLKIVNLVTKEEKIINEIKGIKNLVTLNPSLDCGLNYYIILDNNGKIYVIGEQVLGYKNITEINNYIYLLDTDIVFSDIKQDMESYDCFDGHKCGNRILVGKTKDGKEYKIRYEINNTN